MKEMDHILKGLIIGICVPVVGYALLLMLSEFLVSNGWMDAVTESIVARRMRTTTLIALCFNIIPIQVFQRWRQTKNIQGIVLITLIYAGIWIYYFRNSIQF